MGAFRAVQRDQAGFCGAGGAETSALGTAGSPCQPPPAHTGGFAQGQLPDLPACLPVSTASLAELAVGTLGSTGAEPWHARHLCGARLCPPWGAWTQCWGREWGGAEAGRVCLHMCVCVLAPACVCKATSSGHAVLCHVVPSRAGTRLSRAGSCWRWGGAGHCAAVSPSCGCCAGDALYSPGPGTGQDTRAPGRSGYPFLPTVDPGTELWQPPLATLPARLRGTAAPLACLQPWHHGAKGSPYSVQLWTGGLWPSWLQTGQGSRWHGRLALSQLLMTPPAINKGVGNAPAGPLACSTRHHGGAQHQSQQDAQQDHAGPPDMANRGGDLGTAWAPITGLFGGLREGRSPLCVLSVWV